jgi:hypothetical protein
VVNTLSKCSKWRLSKNRGLVAVWRAKNCATCGRRFARSATPIVAMAENDGGACANAMLDEDAGEPNGVCVFEKHIAGVARVDCLGEDFWATKRSAACAFLKYFARE